MIDLKYNNKDFKYINKHTLKFKHNENYNSFCRRISTVIKDNKIPNTSGEYYRAVGNAVHHGKQPVKCKIYIKKHNKCSIKITDSGNGFDYKDVVNKFKSGEKYYNYHGKGMKVYDSNSKLKVNWDKSGKRIWLHYN